VTLTAWQALDGAVNLTKGRRFSFMQQPAGGHIAVQLAKLRGAKVIGTASVNLDLLRDLGADEAINYSTTSFENVVHNVDVVLDT